AVSRVLSQRIDGSINVIGLENSKENPVRRIPDLPVAHRSPPLLRSGPSRLSVTDYTASAGQGQGIFRPASLDVPREDYTEPAGQVKRIFDGRPEARKGRQKKVGGAPGVLRP